MWPDKYHKKSREVCLLMTINALFSGQTQYDSSWMINRSIHSFRFRASVIKEYGVYWDGIELTLISKFCVLNCSGELETKIRYTDATWVRWGRAGKRFL